MIEKILNHSYHTNACCLRKPNQPIYGMYFESQNRSVNFRQQQLKFTRKELNKIINSGANPPRSRVGHHLVYLHVNNQHSSPNYSAQPPQTVNRKSLLVKYGLVQKCTAMPNHLQFKRFMFRCMRLCAKECTRDI